MKSKVSDEQNGSLSANQLRTLRKFRQRLSAKVPEYRIVWVRPYNERIINVGLESQKKVGYRKMLQAAKVANELEDETGVLILAG